MSQKPSMLKTAPSPLKAVPESHLTNNFDFLRFLGASFVIYGHAYPLSNRGNFDDLQLLSRGLFPTAHMGVALFFVISGYLIAQSLTNSTSGLNFIWKRSLRIFPGLLVAALVTIFVFGALATRLPLSEYFLNRETYRYLLIVKLYPPYPNALPGVFDTTADTSINNSIWTLAYEFTCYLALLGASLLFPRHKRKWILATFVTLWASYFFWSGYFQTTFMVVPVLHLGVYNLLDFSMYFLGGSVAYYYKKYIPFKGSLALGFIAVWIGIYLISENFHVIPLSTIVWFRYLAMPYLVLYLSFLKGPFNRFGRMGDLSYGLYIYAYPIQRIIVAAVGESSPVSEIIVLSFLCTAPLAWLSWKFVEKPFLRLKHVLI
jgi:peptidoglycan/LPS O-acetylase OafA/YrhL